jgi:hypothetical protein
LSRGEINSNRVFKLSGLSETLVLEKLNDLATDHHTSIVCQTGPGEVRVIILSKRKTLPSPKNSWKSFHLK